MTGFASSAGALLSGAAGMWQLLMLPFHLGCGRDVVQPCGQALWFGASTESAMSNVIETLRSEPLLYVKNWALKSSAKPNCQNTFVKTIDLMVWVGRDLETHLIPPPCHGQGPLPPAQGAPSPVQPGLEPCQGGGSHSSSGQPGPGPHHSHCRQFLP